MKFFTAVAAVSTFLAPALAQNAIVFNGCTETAYVQQFANDGTTSALTTLTTGSTFSEAFAKSGATIKIAADKNLGSPLFFGYSFSSDGSIAYYEFSDEFGNPFAADMNSLSAGDGCPAFNCASNSSNSCYSAGNGEKDYECPMPVNLTATLCG